MADQPQQDPNASPWGFPSPDFGALKTQWDQFLGDPRGQAALLSFAAQALQPRQFGQTGLGQVGESLAKGGEAIRGIDTAEEKKAAEESKAALREAQSGAAAARADTATTRTDLAGARLALQQADQDQKRDTATARTELAGTRLALQTMDQERKRDTLHTQQIISAQRLYQLEKAKAEATNAAEQKRFAIFGRPGEQPNLVPVPTIGQWLDRNPHLKPLFEGTAVMGQGGQQTTPQAAPSAPAAAFTPPSTWQKSPSTGYYRDPATKKVYDPNGVEVTQ